MDLIPEFDVVRDVAAVVRAAAPVADGDAGTTGLGVMEVRFSPFNVWYEIDSFWEGQFLERTVSGAFAKTMKEQRSQIKSLFNHGYDFQIGDKVLGTIDDLREEPDSAVGEVGLFDVSYVRDLLPGITAGVYGSSMRMRVIKEAWDDEPGVSDYNPKGLPERTIQEVRLFEFGPVTFPANLAATAGMRSSTDHYYQQLRSRDPQRVERLELVRNSRTLPGQAAGTPTADRDGAAPQDTAEPGSAHSTGISRSRRREALMPALKTKE